jgi:hypothetical protein
MAFHLQPAESKSVVYISVPVHSLIHISLTTKPGTCYAVYWTNIAVSRCIQEVQILNSFRITGYAHRNVGDFLKVFF